MGYASTVLGDAPVAYWPLNETSGATAADATGHGYTAAYPTDGSLTLAGARTLQGSPTPVFHNTRATVGAGQGPGLALTSAAGLPLAPTALTIECWINPLFPAGGAAPSVLGWPTAVLTYGTGPLPADDWFTSYCYVPAGSFWSAAVHPELDGNGPTSGAYTGYGSTLWMDEGWPTQHPWCRSAWRHLAWTWDNSNTSGGTLGNGAWQIYVDGAPWNNVNAAHFSRMSPMSGTASWGRIGSGLAGWDATLTGSLAHVALYDYALTGAQVATHAGTAI